MFLHGQSTICAIFQVLFLTTSSEPYKAKAGFRRIHDKFIFVPMPDYNSLYVLYKELLAKYQGVDRNFDVSTLAKLSRGHNVSSVLQSFDTVMSLEKRMTIHARPLRQVELFDELLSNGATVDDKVIEQFNKFERKMPLVKRRLRIVNERIRLEREKAESEAKRKKKQQR